MSAYKNLCRRSGKDPKKSVPTKTPGLSERNRPIGIFDSGLGGLTVFKAVRRLLPGENIIYFGDTARVPYGTKSKEAVIAFSKEIAEFLSERGVKLLVIACNTASSLALEEVRGITRVPVIGVIEPGARAALGATSNGRILVTGTTATITSGAYRKLIKKLDPGAFIFEKACPLFVPLVEEGWCGKKITELVAEEYLAPLRKSGFDTVILGCTHYPLLKKMIARALGGRIKIVDSGPATASEVRAELRARGLLNPARRGRERYIASDAPDKFKALALRLLNLRVENVKVKRF
ncbi:MAG: glutamate racemase [Elusimicrobia bacterium]|nr:glutamate racemase [Elusimicrobiota bacterium]